MLISTICLDLFLDLDLRSKDEKLFDLDLDLDLDQLSFRDKVEKLIVCDEVDFS